MRSSDLVFSVVNLLFSNTSSGLHVSECLRACDGVNEVFTHPRLEVCLSFTPFISETLN